MTKPASNLVSQQPLLCHKLAHVPLLWHMGHVCMVAARVQVCRGRAAVLNWQVLVLHLTHVAVAASQ